jgi:hypothetical protein
MHNNLPSKMLAAIAVELDRPHRTPNEIMYCSGILFAIGEYHDAIYLQRHAENIKWLIAQQETPDIIKEAASRQAHVTEIVALVLAKIIAEVGEDEIAKAEEGRLP